MTRDTTTRRQFITRTGTAGLALAGAAGLASAEETDGEFAGVFGHEMEVERDYWAFLGGWLNGFTDYGPPPSTETLADRARNEFEANEDAWLSYGNWLIDEHGGTPIEETTIAVDFTITRTGSLFQPGTTQTALSVEFNSEAETVERIDWELEEPDDPEYHVELTNDAAEGAADELQSYRREWIDEDGDGHELPSDEYINELAGQYWSDIRLGSNSHSVVQILLGKIEI